MGSMDQAPNLYDDEIKKVGKILAKLTDKYRLQRNTEANIDSLESEAKHLCFQEGLLVELEFEVAEVGGQAVLRPILEIVGRVNVSMPFDHERKAWEVNKAREAGRR